MSPSRRQARRWAEVTSAAPHRLAWSGLWVDDVGLGDGRCWTKQKLATMLGRPTLPGPIGLSAHHAGRNKQQQSTPPWLSTPQVWVLLSDQHRTSISCESHIVPRTGLEAMGQGQAEAQTRQLGCGSDHHQLPISRNLTAHFAADRFCLQPRLATAPEPTTWQRRYMHAFAERRAPTQQPLRRCTLARTRLWRQATPLSCHQMASLNERRAASPAGDGDQQQAEAGGAHTAHAVRSSQLCWTAVITETSELQCQGHTSNGPFLARHNGTRNLEYHIVCPALAWSHIPSASVPVAWYDMVALVVQCTDGCASRVRGTATCTALRLRSVSESDAVDGKEAHFRRICDQQTASLRPPPPPPPSRRALCEVLAIPWCRVESCRAAQASASLPVARSLMVIKASEVLSIEWKESTDDARSLCGRALDLPKLS
ncbi:uncharacterized protein PSFLO_02787 [Pseudozyma flocculosa]|uniref:Uncharacterized protein n=1 Tax=Pseudozyma flocculosa TaxID=84751 RepID=A0A5C3EYI4_9BASI|nr:uncharacterized protein PSFLO_02787 [Pseudozyma flocculosa]